MEDFYREALQEVFRAICAVVDSGQPCDLITVTAELRQRGTLDYAGGIEYLDALTRMPPTERHWREYADILKKLSIQRSAIIWANSIEQKARAQVDVPDLIADIVSGGVRLADEAKVATTNHISDYFDADSEALMENVSTPMGLTPAQWGVAKLDAHTGGLGNFYLVLLMAGPGVGKTRLANHAVMSSMIEFAKEARATGDKPPAILVFPLEEGRRSWIRNAVAWQASIDSQLLLRGRCAENQREMILDRVTTAHAKLCEYPFCIGENVTSGRELVSRIRVEVSKRRVGLVVVDYLQRLARTVDQERQELGQIAIELQSLAESVPVPIILLSQMSVSASSGELLPYGGRGPQFDASLVVLIERDYDEENRPLPQGTLKCLKSRGVPEFPRIDYCIDYEHGAKYYDRETWEMINRVSGGMGKRLDVKRGGDPYGETGDSRNW